LVSLVAAGKKHEWIMRRVGFSEVGRALIGSISLKDREKSKGTENASFSVNDK
jgi:hypothetical protein